MILLEKKWKLPENTDLVQAPLEAQGAQGARSAAEIVDQLLKTRGIEAGPVKDNFLAKLPEDWHDPFQMNDMQIAVERILAALQNKEKILISGDYDADGVTATSILVLFLKKLGADVDYVLPNRLVEGYGLSDLMVTRIEEIRPQLLITVDCGISNPEQVQHLMETGMDVIVTDHHVVLDELPPALAVIDCKRPDNTYPCVDLCGAGVALKLVQALCMKMPGRIPVDTWKQYIDVAAIGTIADVVSMTDENRTIVKHGLRMLAQGSRIGLAALLDVARQSSSAQGKPSSLNERITATDIGFQVTPRINACGRMGDTTLAVELLLCEDAGKAKQMAQKLNDENVRRQELEQKIVEEAVQQIQTDPRLIEDMKIASMPLIVVGENWHSGIIGIVANRLVDRFQHSAIVLTRIPDQPGMLKGSCRSAGNFPILDCLKSCGDVLSKFGGHARAGGLDLAQENLPAFIDKVRDYALVTNADTDSGFLQVDTEIRPENLKLDLAKALAHMEPYGEGNREPVFLIRNLVVAQTKPCGAENRHLKILFVPKQDVAAKAEGQGATLNAQGANAQGANPNAQQAAQPMRIDAIAFFMGEYADMFAVGSTVDVLVKLGTSIWNDRENLSIRVQDIHFSKIGMNMWDMPGSLESLYRNKLPLKQVALVGKCRPEDLIPKEDEIKMVIQYLQANCGREMNMVDLPLLARLLTGHYRRAIHAFKLSRILDMFQEAGLIQMARVSDERIWFTLLSDLSEGKLDGTNTYRALYSL